jgi:hypothetical protein
MVRLSTGMSTRSYALPTTFTASTMLELLISERDHGSVDSSMHRYDLNFPVSCDSDAAGRPDLAPEALPLRLYLRCASPRQILGVDKRLGGHALLFELIQS